MHPNQSFHTATDEENITFARDRGFGILTVNSIEEDKGPLVSHIPFVLSDDNTGLGAHLVRSNPIVRALEEKVLPALLVVSGPDGYISPDWYGLEDQVPTWNYVAVHLRGTLRRLPDDHLLPHLEALSEHFERRLSPKAVWTLDKVSPEALVRLLRMIAPVEFTIESVDGTWKLSQNKSENARFGAAAGVASAERDTVAAELAAMMKAASVLSS